jgi:hypothetical protein
MNEPFQHLGISTLQATQQVTAADAASALEKGKQRFVAQ